MEIYDEFVCWPSLIHRLSLEWELVRKTVSQKDISQKCLPADTQLAHTDRHTHTFILSTVRGHLPNQLHPSIHTRSYCTSLIWCSDSDDSISFLRDWGDGGTDRMGVVFQCEWQEAETEIYLLIFIQRGRWGDSRVHRVQFIPPSACVFISPPLPDDHLSPPHARQSVSTFLSFCLACPTVFLALFFFFLLSWVMGGWISPFHPCGSHCIQENNVRPINRV